MTADDARPVRIRSMRPDDREFILSLTSRLEAVGTPPWRDPAKMHAFHQRYAEATLNATGPDEAVFVADNHHTGERLGVVHVMESNDGLTGERQGYVATLAVSDEAAGNGIGRLLMQHAETWSRDRNLRIVALDVFAHNRGARRFYSRLGYQDETLKMVKDLST